MSARDRPDSSSSTQHEVPSVTAKSAKDRDLEAQVETFLRDFEADYRRRIEERKRGGK